MVPDFGFLEGNFGFLGMILVFRANFGFSIWFLVPPFGFRLVPGFSQSGRGLLLTKN